MCRREVVRHRVAWAGIAGAILGLCGAAGGVSAADVVLRLRDGDGFEIAGNLASFDGANYVVEARAFGRLKLEAARYDCIGPGCVKAPEPAAPQLATLSLEPQANTATTEFAIEGADAVSLSLLPSLIRGYAASIGASAAQLVGADPRQMRFRITARRGGVTLIDVKRSDSASALEALTSGRAAIALSGRPMTDGERAALERSAARQRDRSYEHVIGLDGLAVIVAPSNPAKVLKVTDVARILRGEVTDWSALGLPAGPIHLYASAEKGGAAERFAEIALDSRGFSLPAATKMLPDEVQLSDAVARDPLGIAVTSLAFVRNSRGIEIANTCGLIWKPTPFAVKSEEYPLSRRLYLYTAGETRSEMAQALVAFASSAEGQATVRDSQLVDQSFDFLPYADEQTRIDTWAGMPLPQTSAERDVARAVPAALQPGKRLSTTLRFARNSYALDAKARQDLQRLAAYLRSPEMVGKTLLLAGYTDITGSFSYNVQLSQERAASVRDALIDAAGRGRVDIVTKGFGPAAPVACNDGDRDRFLNRRVEIWVLDGKGGSR